MTKISTLKKITLSLLACSLLAPMTPMSVLANSDLALEAKQEYGDLERKVIGYFPEWSYKSEEHNYFNATDLQWESLTHIQYSFAMIDGETNQLTFGDKHAAVEETFEGMDLSYNGEIIELDETLPYQGHFNVLQVMKQKFPDVKLLLSTGGWAGSRNFYTMLDTDEGIDTFTDSAVAFIREYGFDGIDIDFEFPSSTSQSGNPDDFDLSEPRRETINARYNEFMRVLREKLDAASSVDGEQYLLTAAVSASSWVLGGVESNEYANYLDFLSIMSYDFHGGWNQFVENQANIYGDPADKETAGMMLPVLSLDWAYKYYRGVLPPEKIIMGIPYYTRGWENVQGGTNGLHGTSNQPATGKYNIWADLDANGNPIPAGVNPLWHVLNLMEQDPNLQVHWDEVGQVPYVWQDQEKVFLTFENEQSIDARLDYIEENNLGGALIWVMDGDYGLNENYVPGSTDINEGKYTFGDTLTSQLMAGLDEMGPAEKTQDQSADLESIDVDVTLTGNYDHPNYTYDFEVVNNTTETIQGGWELAFDLPKSAVFKSAWGGTVTQEDNGDFTRITIKSSGWQTLAPGEKTNLQGMIGLCFSGVQNVTFNGKAVNGNGNNNPNPEPTPNQKPTFSGVANKTITVGDTFDALAGVKATDKEDGDLTSQIKVSGTVDSAVAGTYTLTYTVTDSQGLTTTATRVITVQAEVIEPEVNTAPTFSGVANKTITVGDTFDALAGVKATDKEDGDLTSQIKVSGNVDSAVAGTYTLTYAVTDSKGLTTTATRVITVQAEVIEPPVDPSGDTFELNKVYNTGDKVIYNGVEYTAKWWVQGEYPDQSAAWERKIAVNPDGSQDYVAGSTYTEGMIVNYNGEQYKANWWTQSVPGSDSSWTKLSNNGSSSNGGNTGGETASNEYV
ncbi:MAG: glycosyl hydrolase family 18 protein, partial [Culicoidibacterales bacterium]